MCWQINRQPVLLVLINTLENKVEIDDKSEISEGDSVTVSREGTSNELNDESLTDDGRTQLGNDTDDGSTSSRSCTPFPGGTDGSTTQEKCLKKRNKPESKLEKLFKGMTEELCKAQKAGDERFPLYVLDKYIEKLSQKAKEMDFFIAGLVLHYQLKKETSGLSKLL